MPILPFKGVWPTVAHDTFIAPGAVVIGDVTIHEGVSIWYNAVVRGDTAPIVIGRNSNIQDNSTLHVDADAPLIIGAECTIGHNAVVHGATVGDRVLIGMNAVVLSHAQVGTQTMIGACALLGEGRSVPAGVLALGVPAKVVRELTESERQHLVESADSYVELARLHKASMP
ncbi:MAG: gamma carbonic anhydrase family protein [Chloroflexi bacterium]|nr:gamma carbonic anhydrase family protein [Ktedonobacteraceae bacterium]MBV8822443.1 gamma carbonic anhydrase family protein [Ktedonobacteraceae bacterium]MBV9021165.1 gamma carbonic anhydrase family protein [Ktedonobacteraceae bacterium]MBV9706570.1 gamma carbonic anhydrase family protein [Chloroflexota bacterium]